MHPIRCACGTVQGTLLGGAPNNRVRCYCSDCRAFGRYFGPDSNVLDAQGGTEIVQVAQHRVRIAQGLDQLAAIRLSRNGLVRWYARCCRTPIGNTMRNPRWSFIGLIHTCLQSDRMDADFGSEVGAVNTGSAIGSPKPRQHGMLGSIVKFAQIVIPAQLRRGDRDTQFFTASGEPIAIPHILQASEVERLKAVD